MGKEENCVEVDKNSFDIFDKTDTCWNSRWLRGHNVGEFVDYADTTITTQTLSEIFGGFSQILKEQSSEKSTWCVYTPNAIILKNLAQVEP